MMQVTTPYPLPCALPCHVPSALFMYIQFGLEMLGPVFTLLPSSLPLGALSYTHVQGDSYLCFEEAAS